MSKNRRPRKKISAENYEFLAKKSRTQLKQEAENLAATGKIKKAAYTYLCARAYHEALELYETIEVKGSSKLHVAECYQEIAKVLYDIEEYEEANQKADLALQYCFEVLEMQEPVYRETVYRPALQKRTAGYRLVSIARDNLIQKPDDMARAIHHLTEFYDNLDWKQREISDRSVVRALQIALQEMQAQHEEETDSKAEAESEQPDVTMPDIINLIDEKPATELTSPKALFSSVSDESLSPLADSLATAADESVYMAPLKKSRSLDCKPVVRKEEANSPRLSRTGSLSDLTNQFGV